MQVPTLRNAGRFHAPWLLCLGLIAAIMPPALVRAEGVPQVGAARSDLIGCEEKFPELKTPVSAATELDGRAYRIVGSVIVRKMGTTTFSRPSVKSLLPRLVKQSAPMHPDAILGLHTGTQGTLDGGERYRWVSGMAVVFDPEADASSRVLRDDVVAIPHVLIPDSLIAEADKREKVSAWLQLGITYHLEERGYYTATYAESPAPTGVDELNALDDEAFANAFGPWTGNVLLVRLGTKSSSNIGIAAGSEVGLHGALYSRRARQLVWEGDSEGSSIQLGLLNALLGSGYRRSMYNATSALIKRFPVHEAFQ